MSNCKSNSYKLFYIILALFLILIFFSTFFIVVLNVWDWYFSEEKSSFSRVYLHFDFLFLADESYPLEVIKLYVAQSFVFKHSFPIIVICRITVKAEAVFVCVHYAVNVRYLDNFYYWFFQHLDSYHFSFSSLNFVFRLLTINSSSVIKICSFTSKECQTFISNNFNLFLLFYL